MKTTMRTLFAPVFISGIALTFVACGQGGAGKTPIAAAKPTAAGVKLLACADTKLTTEVKTFKGADGKVCRLKNGKITDETIPVLFSGVKRDKRIGVFQTVIVDIAVHNEDGSVVKIDKQKDDVKTLLEYAAVEDSVTGFINKACRPIAKRVFTRGEIEADVLFRSITDADKLARPNAAPVDGSTPELSNEPFGGTVRRTENSEKTRKTGDGSPDKPRTAPIFTGRSEYHSILKIDVKGEGKDRQIKIADEVEGVSSGSLDVVTKPNDDQVRFCNQLVLRVGENFGLTKRRDCASREEDQAAAPGDKQSAKDAGLMKAGSNTNLDSVKVSEEEVSDLVKPVCGSI